MTSISETPIKHAEEITPSPLGRVGEGLSPSPLGRVGEGPITAN